MFQTFCFILATCVLTLAVFGAGFVCGWRRMSQRAARDLENLNARLGYQLEKSRSAESMISAGTSKLHLQQR